MYACVTINIMQPKRKYPVAVHIRQNLDDLMNALVYIMVIWLIDIGWGSGVFTLRVMYRCHFLK